MLCNTPLVLSIWLPEIEGTQGLLLDSCTVTPQQAHAVSQKWHRLARQTGRSTGLLELNAYLRRSNVSKARFQRIRGVLEYHRSTTSGSVTVTRPWMFATFVILLSEALSSGLSVTSLGCCLAVTLHTTSGNKEVPSCRHYKYTLLASRGKSYKAPSNFPNSARNDQKAEGVPLWQSPHLLTRSFCNSPTNQECAIGSLCPSSGTFSDPRGNACDLASRANRGVMKAYPHEWRGRAISTYPASRASSRRGRTG
ncbi:hypothetical protein CALVIDRAFT_94161 [Calocera viscosa TUFC12733]|uniref:Uncharacterized protein n=1 Tax=Calocera viscosa (strain TUFC12733) TaxID=1330018 RepID=A0A167MX69_CALVF|nr:hypothetical protein CALVIDRAFT_94161 [Calocera viscosa TUFC12733]